MGNNVCPHGDYYGQCGHCRDAIKAADRTPPELLAAIGKLRIAESSLAALQAENARLKGLVQGHNDELDWVVEALPIQDRHGDDTGLGLRERAEHFAKSLAKLYDANEIWLERDHDSAKKIRALRAMLAKLNAGEMERLTEERDAAQALVRSLHPIECPCCGDIGAVPDLYSEDTPTICGCGGQVMLDEDGPDITVNDCVNPKCLAQAEGGGSDG